MSFHLLFDEFVSARFIFRFVHSDLTQNAPLVVITAARAIDETKSLADYQASIHFGKALLSDIASHSRKTVAWYDCQANASVDMDLRPKATTMITSILLASESIRQRLLAMLTLRDVSSPLIILVEPPDFILFVSLQRFPIASHGIVDLVNLSCFCF